MAIKWEDIQNLNVTNTEINLLAGLIANAVDINKLSGFTGTTQDLNDGVGATAAIQAHEALDFIHAHTLVENALDGLIIADGTISESKLSFDVATQVELNDVQDQLNVVKTNNQTQQDQIDNLYSIVIPGQGDDLAEAIQKTIEHIENPVDAHDATAISFGNNYFILSDLSSGATSLVVDPSLIRTFRKNDILKFQDDITAAETTNITDVDYNTNTIYFDALTNDFSVANNAQYWTLSEDTTREAIDRSLKNNTDIFTGRLTILQDHSDHALVLSQLGVGDELHFTRGIIGSDTGYDFELEDNTSFSINHDIYGESFLVNTSGDGYLTQVLLREDGTIFHGKITKNITADRTWTFRDLDNIIGNPDMSGNEKKYLRVQVGESDTEWVIIQAVEVTYDNTTSGLASTQTQAAIDELDSTLDDLIIEVHNHINNADIHRVINDSSTSTTDLWSADKISRELSDLNDTVPHLIDDLDDVDTSTNAPIAGQQLTWDGSNWIPGTAGEVNTASNRGTGTAVFAGKIGYDLQFKTLVGGTDILLSANSDEITIASQIDVSNIGTGEQIYKQKNNSTFELKTIVAGSNIILTDNGDDITISSTGGSGGVGGTGIERTQANHGFSVLNPIYHDGTIWKKAKANNPDTLAEYVVTEVVDQDNFVAFKFGEVEVLNHGLSIGDHYFLSENTAGGYSVTEASTYSAPVFYVEDANTIQIEVYRPSEITGSDGLNEQESIVVGTAADVSAGLANYSTLQDAHDAANDGDTIEVLKRSIAGNTVITKRLSIFGRGNASELTGTLTFSSGGDKNLVKYLKFSGNVTIDNGVKNNIITDCWAANGISIIDNNAASDENLLIIIQE